MAQVHAALPFCMTTKGRREKSQRVASGERGLNSVHRALLSGGDGIIAGT